MDSERVHRQPRPRRRVREQLEKTSPDLEDEDDQGRGRRRRCGMVSRAGTAPWSKPAGTTACPALGAPARDISLGHGHDSGGSGHPQLGVGMAAERQVDGSMDMLARHSSSRPGSSPTSSWATTVDLECSNGRSTIGLFSHRKLCVTTEHENLCGYHPDMGPDKRLIRRQLRALLLYFWWGRSEVTRISIREALCHMKRCRRFSR